MEGAGAERRGEREGDPPGERLDAEEQPEGEPAEGRVRDARAESYNFV